MANIYDLLEQINSAIYGEDVRESIHDAIEQCYKDATGDSENFIASVRSLTELYSEFNDIGTTINAENNTSSINVPNSEFVILASVALTTGRWLIIYGGQWQTNAAGARWMDVNKNGDAASVTNRYTITNMGNGNMISETRVIIYDITDEETVYLWGWQNCGSALINYPVLTAIKIVGDIVSESEMSDIRDVVALHTEAIAELETKTFSIDANDYLTIG